MGSMERIGDSDAMDVSPGAPVFGFDDSRAATDALNDEFCSRWGVSSDQAPHRVMTAEEMREYQDALRAMMTDEIV